MHISTHLFFTLKNAWVVSSSAPAVVFKIDEVLTFSWKLLSQQQNPNILSLFGTVLPKGINQIARTQGQIQGMDSHRLIKFTDAPFFFFFPLVRFLHALCFCNCYSSAGGAGGGRIIFFSSLYIFALSKVHYFPSIFQSVFHVRFSSDVCQSFDVSPFWRGRNQIANRKLPCVDLTCWAFHRKVWSWLEARSPLSASGGLFFFFLVPVSFNDTPLKKEYIVLHYHT